MYLYHPDATDFIWIGHDTVANNEEIPYHKVNEFHEERFSEMFDHFYHLMALWENWHEENEFFYLPITEDDWFFNEICEFLKDDLEKY